MNDGDVIEVVGMTLQLLAALPAQEDRHRLVVVTYQADPAAFDTLRIRQVGRSVTFVRAELVASWRGRERDLDAVRHAIERLERQADLRLASASVPLDRLRICEAENSLALK